MAADAAYDRAEAHAAYHALENVADAVLSTRTTSVTDLTIKARALGSRGVEGIGYFYRAEDVMRFFADVQNFAAV
jgi:hypothetical protein